MEITNKHAKDFTISIVYGEANSISTYENIGSRREIQWLYLLGGNLKIQYKLNGYTGSYDMYPDFLADLRPINGLNTEWISGQYDFCAVAFSSVDETQYNGDIITVTTYKEIDPSTVDRIIVPLINNISINNTSVEQFAAARIPANKSIVINSVYPDSPIFIFEKHE
jgi:hypothetical protein